MENTQEKNEKRMKYLKMAADEAAIRFLSPIYLVGSYIEKGIDARDIDLLMVVSEKRWKRLFFNDGDFNDRVFEFRKKEKHFFEQYVTDMDIDFKVVTMDGLMAVDKKKIKLDSIMEFPE